MHILFLIKNAQKIYFLPWVYHYAYVDKVAQIVMQLLLRRVPTFTNTQISLQSLITAGLKRTGGDNLSPLFSFRTGGDRYNGHDHWVVTRIGGDNSHHSRVTFLTGSPESILRTYPMLPPIRVLPYYQL